MIESRVFEAIKRRRSIREYASKPVEEEKLLTILEAARLAPSATNTQPWFFYVVKDVGIKKQIAYAMPAMTYGIMNAFIENAPVLIVGCANPLDLLHRAAALFSGRDWSPLDVTIALEHMVLTATDLNLGTCWIGWFSEAKVRKILQIPRKQKIIAMLTLGYPKDASTAEAIGGVPAKSRLPLADIVKFI